MGDENWTTRDMLKLQNCSKRALENGNDETIQPRRTPALARASRRCQTHSSMRRLNQPLIWAYVVSDLAMIVAAQEESGSSSEKGTKVNLGAILGGVLGGGTAILILMVWLYKRSQKTREAQRERQQMPMQQGYAGWSPQNMPPWAQTPLGDAPPSAMPPGYSSPRTPRHRDRYDDDERDEEAGPRKPSRSRSNYQRQHPGLHRAGSSFSPGGGGGSGYHARSAFSAPPGVGPPGSGAFSPPPPYAPNGSYFGPPSASGFGSGYVASEPFGHSSGGHARSRSRSRRDGGSRSRSSDRDRDRDRRRRPRKGDRSYSDFV